MRYQNRLSNTAISAAVFLVTLFAVSRPTFSQELQSSIPQILLIDSETGAELYSKNKEQTFAPASLAKLMTAEIVFEALKNGKITEDTEFSVSEYAWRTGGAPSRTTTMFAGLNTRISVKNLLRGLMVVQGNDAAIILAEGLAGSEDNFATLMNEQAQKLGMTSSHFVNATGLPKEGQKVTMSDMARLARHIFNEHEDGYKIYNEESFEWNRIFQKNRNPLHTSEIGVDGLVFGFSNENGFSEVVSSSKGQKRLFLVLNGAKTDKERNRETEKILNWGMTNFKPSLIYAPQSIIGQAQVYGGQQSKVNLLTQESIGVLLPQYKTIPLKGRILYNGPLMAPVKKGEKVGTLQILSEKNILIEKPVYTAEDIEKTGFYGKSIDALYEVCFGWMRDIAISDWIVEKIESKRK